MRTTAGAGLRSLKGRVEHAMFARFPRRRSHTLIGAVALLIATASPAAAPPGDLDPTFDVDGKVTTNFAGSFSEANGVAIQEDGKIVAAGQAQIDFALARYNTDGSLDPTFGVSGKVTTDFGGDFGEEANAVTIQGDGRIVAAGCVNCSRTMPTIGDFALARYNTDGSLDPTFGGDGQVMTDFDLSGDQAFAVAIQDDGKIVAAGSARVHGTLGFFSINFALARYNTDGSLDPTFDGDGKLTTDFALVEELRDSNDFAHGVAIRKDDGKIVAAGRAVFCNESCEVAVTSDFAVAQYNADGSLDTTFDGDGKVTTGFTTPPPGSEGGFDRANAVAIQEDGKIVAVGEAPPDLALARYNTDGSLDTTFDGDGKVTTSFGSARGVAIQEDGKIVAAGIAGSDFSLARYNTDGSLDPTFGVSGKVTTNFDGSSDEANAVAIQEDGKIVAAGSARVLGDHDFALARYRADFETDLSITKTGPPGRVPTGRNMTYTLTVTNNGPDSASGVTVTDQLPSTVTFVSATATQGSCAESNGTVSCTLGEMSNGAIVTIEIVVRPTTAGRITNSALVASSTSDSNQANNADSVDTSICRITSRRSSIPCG